MFFGDGGFEADGHEGVVEGFHFLDGAALDGFLGTAHHGEDDGVAGFALDEAGEGAAVFGFDGVGAPAGFEHAVGIEDV